MADSNDRLSQLLPWWPAVVLPPLIIGLIALAVQQSSLARQLTLAEDDLTALQQQVAMMKRPNAGPPPTVEQLLQNRPAPQRQPREEGEARGRKAGAGSKARSAEGGARQGKAKAKAR